MATKIALTGLSTLGVTTDVITPYRYQWLRNGQYVTGTQEKSLTITNLTAADSVAKYSVIVTGQDGRQETSNELVISTVRDAAAKPTVVPNTPVGAPEVKP